MVKKGKSFRKEKIIILSIVAVVAVLMAFMLIKTLSSQTLSISEEKCSSLSDEAADDCWHGLAHLEANASRCQNINDSEKKEHCLEHTS